MMNTPEDAGSRTMSGRTWNRYLENWEQEHNYRGTYEWPGDEWGTPESWDALFQHLFVASGVANWQHVVEIGPGSGKYTDRVLQGSRSTIRAYDVSTSFMEVCERRCAAWIEAERLSLNLIEGQSPSEILDDLSAAGLVRNIDAFFSIDAMVHVDLQYLVVYLIIAALSLREGGKLILTLSNATSKDGFEKLLRDVTWTYPQQGDPCGSGKFEWLSPDLVSFVLSELGFGVRMLPGEGRDIWLIATLIDVTKEAAIEGRLRSVPTPREEPR